MSLSIVLEIWVGGAIVLGLASCIYSGRTGDADPVGGVVCAMIWPFFAVAAIVVGPFWLAYKLGTLLP